MRTRLARVIAARLLVATLFLGSAIAIDVVAPESHPIHPLVGLIGLTYVLSVIYLMTLRAAERWPAIVDLQFAADALLVSAFIHLTGGIASHFSSLYTLPIIAASTVRGRRGALQVAWLGATLYTGIVVAQYLDVSVVPEGWWRLPATTLPTPGFAQYTVAINLSGMFAVALLSGSLAERLRSARAGLVDASYEIADLRKFNDHLIDSLTSGLATTDARGRIVTFNRAATRILGVEAEQAIGRDVRDILQLPNDPASSGPMDLKSLRLEVPFTTAVGQALDIGLTISPLHFPEGTEGYLIAFQDITALKRMERDTRMRQRLAAVGEMAAGIAHEIRNPLASVFGSLQLLRGEVALTEEQGELMDIALRESDRLNERIRLFLAYARPQRFATAPVDLGRIIQDSVQQLRTSVDARNDHEIVADVPYEDAYVECDEAEVRQILWSLGTNGLRAMAQGGRLRISGRIEAHRGGICLSLTVEDQGCGIPAAEVDQIFQPFRRAFAQGTGLGLAIVHRIVTDHGGDVEVASTVGVGTTVRVRLPVADPAKTEAVDGLSARRSA